MKRLMFILATSLLTALSAFSQALPATRASEASSAPINYEAVRLSRVATAVRITEPIVLDGHLAEAAWQEAPPAKDFIQLSPHPGEPSPNPTEVRILYDDDNLYVGVNCFDPDPSRIIINDLTDDFNFGQSDAINIIFDTLHDRRSGFMFMTNAAGARRHWS